MLAIPSLWIPAVANIAVSAMMTRNSFFVDSRAPSARPRSPFSVLAIPSLWIRGVYCCVVYVVVCLAIPSLWIRFLERQAALASKLSRNSFFVDSAIREFLQRRGVSLSQFLLCGFAVLQGLMA